MRYLVHITIQIRDGTLESAASALAPIGLRNQLRGSTDQWRTLPENAFAGEFNGESAARIRDDLAEQVRSALASRGVHARVFMSVSGQWAWAIRLT